MFDSLGFVLAVGVVWLAIGLTLSVVMGRRGHDSFGWLVLGTVLGPLGIFLAVDAWGHDEVLAAEQVKDTAAPTIGAGPIDVLVGYDGSPESAAALESVRALFGQRLGRLTVATVVPYGGIRERQRTATEMLRRLSVGGDPIPNLEILHGHPSVALRDFAVEEGYEVIAIGTRGAGITKGVLGSAATELAHVGGKLPVLLVGTP